MADIARLGPERLEIFRALGLQAVGDGGPQPNLAHRLRDHELIAAGVPEPVQVVEFLPLMRVEPGERITAATGRHGVDDVRYFRAEQPLDVEHSGEVGAPTFEQREVAVLAHHGIAHERKGCVPDTGCVLQALRRTPGPATATEYIRVLRRRAVDVGGNVLGEPRALGCGAKAGVHVFMTRIRTLERLVHPALVALGPGEAEGESRIGVAEAAVHVPVWLGLVALLVGVDVRRTEKVVGHDIGGYVNRFHVVPFCRTGCAGSRS